MSTGHNTPPSPRAREAAFSLVETLCGMTLMFVGLLSLAGSTVTGMAANETNRENAMATTAVRRFLETMQAGETPFEDLFRAYATDPSDAVDSEEVDPALALKAPRGVFQGRSGLHPILAKEFAVPGLEPRKGKLRAEMGSASFPVAEGAEGLELREDVAGRDLNGDGVIDSENHADDYRLLPVTVKVEWQGARGAREIEMQTLLIRR